MSDRAKVICHMELSIDGSIDGTLEKYKSDPKEPFLGDYFDVYFKEFAGSSRFLALGRHTASQAGKFLSTPLPAADLPKETLRTDYVDPVLSEAGRKERFIAIIDRNGKLAWEEPVMGDTLAQLKGVRYLSVVVEDLVSDEFLAHCRRTGIPYLFAGKSDFEPQTFLAKVKSLLKEETVVLIGGGVVNAPFLKAGCIDQISIITTPFVCGNLTDTRLFQPSKSENPADALPPTQCVLKKFEKTPFNRLWALYDVQRE